jgi:hypothetical protein
LLTILGSKSAQLGAYLVALWFLTFDLKKS